jgi:sulfite reductase alpha subunit-like flavoprotein
MIGPGTGVAPFRNVIHHRIASMKGSNECNLFLFFGCRNREKDFYCQKEWQEFESEGSLKHFVAFSRDQEETVYVQDKVVAMIRQTLNG